MAYHDGEDFSAMNSILKLRFSRFACLFLFAAATLCASRAMAQSAADVAKIVATLPADTHALLDRLASMRELPDAAWKFHAGDLAHAEAVNLDESGWQPIALKSKAPNDAVWFRQTYQVPAALAGYDLTGARIWFQFHADANGPMPEILYFNGRRVAMGDDLEPVVLFDSAKPGDKVTVAVKLLHTVDTKTFRGATLKIDFPEGRPSPEDLREEFLSAALLVPALAPNDADKMATLNDAIRTVDLAALDANDQAKFDASLKAAHAKLEALTPLLQQATFHLTGNSHIDAAWLWPWTESVDVVKRTFGTALQLMYEYPDYTYTQSAAAYNEWLADKYPSMNAEIARRIKEGRWEIVGGMWVEPDLNMPDGESLVRQLLVGKRWYKQAYGVDVRIGWNPDSFGYTWQLPQIYKKSGIDYFVTQKMAWCDTNQLPFKFFWWQSPDGSKVLTYFPHDYGNQDLNPVRLARDFTIAQKQATGLPGIMDLYGIGDHGGGPTRAILDEGFHWANGNLFAAATAASPSGATAVSPSGATAVSPSAATVSSPCSVSGHDFSRAASAASKEGALAPAGTSNCLVTPRIEFGTAQSYFTALEKQIAPDSPVWDYASIAKGYTPPQAVPGMVNIPTWKSELYFEYHRGVMTTQANHKRNMREAEEEVLNAEKWASLAWLDGKSYPGAELTEDWKKVLFNQFHDTAAGSGIGQIYKDAQKDYDVVRWSTNEIGSGALGALTEKINTQGKSWNLVPVVVFNPLGWTRSGEVPVPVTGYQGPFSIIDPKTGTVHESTALAREVRGGVESYIVPVENVPAFGYRVLQIDHAWYSYEGPQDRSSVESRNDAWVLANSRVRVAIDKQTGCITSLQSTGDHWQTGYEAVARGACGNELQAFKDTPKAYDAWNIDPGTLDQPPTLLTKTDSVELVGKSNSNPAVRVTRTWQNSKFVQTITIPDYSDMVDIDNDIDWHESHVLLKAAFPLAASGPFATYEIPYGTIDRPTTRNNSWEKAQFEVEAMRWADLSGPGPDGKVHGLSVLNQTKYGYDAVGNTLRLTLLRSPKWPDPEADMGLHHFHYALYPHAGTWKEALTVRHGYEYNYPLTAVVTTAHPGTLPASHSFASVAPENVVLTTVKKAEDANGLIFRVYEWAGKETTAEFHVPPGATSATVTNLMETPEGAPLAVVGDVVRAPIHPYEILTIRVDYPNGGPKQ
jgi:alpha-mannosidase